MSVSSKTVRLTGHHARRKLPSKSLVLWDSEVPGFGLRVLSTGKRSWIIRFRDRLIRRSNTIGHPPEMTVATARRIARQKAAEARLVGLPTPRPRPAGEGATFAQVADELMFALARKWKPATAYSNQQYLKRKILPFFGDMPIASIVRADVMRWRDNFASLGGAFNRSLPVLSALMQEAEVFGYRRQGANPCKGIARYKRKRMERFLSIAECRRLFEVLSSAEVEMPVAVPLIRLLVLTGARVGEIAGMRWEWVKGGRVFLPDSKTGAKVIYLSAPARSVLDSLGDKGRGLIFPSSRTIGKPFKISPLWQVLRRRAGLLDVRLHDLRHSYASLAIRDGISLTVISRLLGHALPETTERYAHLADDSVSDAAGRVCRAIATGLGGRA